MDAVAERLVTADLAVDVEAVPIGECRSSRLADPFSSTMTLPSGTVRPWRADVSGDVARCTGEGAS